MLISVIWTCLFLLMQPKQIALDYQSQSHCYLCCCCICSCNIQGCLLLQVTENLIWGFNNRKMDIKYKKKLEMQSLLLFPWLDNLLANISVISLAIHLLCVASGHQNCRPAAMLNVGNQKEGELSTAFFFSEKSNFPRFLLWSHRPDLSYMATLWQGRRDLKWVLSSQ